MIGEALSGGKDRTGQKRGYNQWALWGLWRCSSRGHCSRHRHEPSARLALSLSRCWMVTYGLVCCRNQTYTFDCTEILHAPVPAVVLFSLRWIYFRYTTRSFFLAWCLMVSPNPNPNCCNFYDLCLVMNVFRPQPVASVAHQECDLENNTTKMVRILVCLSEPSWPLHYLWPVEQPQAGRHFGSHSKILFRKRVVIVRMIQLFAWPMEPLCKWIPLRTKLSCAWVDLWYSCNGSLRGYLTFWWNGFVQSLSAISLAERTPLLPTRSAEKKIKSEMKDGNMQLSMLNWAESTHRAEFYQVDCNPLGWKYLLLVCRVVFVPHPLMPLDIAIPPRAQKNTKWKHEWLVGAIVSTKDRVLPHEPKSRSKQSRDFEGGREHILKSHPCLTAWNLRSYLKYVIYLLHLLFGNQRYKKKNMNAGNKYFLAIGPAP